jgi:hypothetical protein
MGNGLFMSSSENTAFWRGLALALVSAFGLACGASWIVDPFGSSRSLLGGPSLCAAGVKSGSPHRHAPLIIVSRRPDTIVLGSSRVLNGFDQAALVALGGNAANLGMPGATIIEMQALLDLAQSRNRLRHVVIGIDPGMVMLPPRPSQLAHIDASTPNTVIAIRHGLIGRDAMIAALRHAHRCRSPQFHPNGSMNHMAFAPLPADEASIALRRTVAPLRPSRANAGGAMTTQLAKIDALISDAAKDGARITMILGPHRSGWNAAIAQAGLATENARFRADIAAIASIRNVQFIDADAPDFADVVSIVRCANDTLDCHFINANHYGARIGQALARLATR